MKGYAKLYLGMNTRSSKTAELSNYLEQTLSASVKIKSLRNPYYAYLAHVMRTLIPKDTSVIEFGCREGNLLATLANRAKVGVEASKSVVSVAKKKQRKIRFIFAPLYNWSSAQTYDYIVITNIFSHLPDVQQFIQKTITPLCHEKTRVVVISFNFLWKPLLDLVSFLGLRTPSQYEPNWLSAYDIENMFRLEGLEVLKRSNGLLFPFNVPLFSTFLNRFLSPLLSFLGLGLVDTSVFRPNPPSRSYSVSVIIPARNEEGNIPKLLDRIPRIGSALEVLFIEGHSRDNTQSAIRKEIDRYKGPIKARLFKQKGIGKKDAVQLGFQKAKNELIIILDADLTVDPSELPKFYHALETGKGDLVIGTRLVYPMEKQAMRTLNYMGNKFFSLAFSFLLDQRIKDTLCGTKALLKETYERTVKAKKLWGDIDPYGDFDLIFGASKLNLKIVEIPIRYKERSYGTSNITRFQHGLLLLRMTIAAAQKLKFA